MWENKTLTIYPLDKKMQIKALQEGPLPFLFNMKAAEAQQRYAMWLIGEDKNEYSIVIAPRMEIDRDSFIKAELKLSKETFLPNELTLWKNGGKEREVFKFNGANDMVLSNVTMTAKFFELQKFEGWKTIVNKGDAAAVPAGGGAPAGGAPPRQQATQPGVRPNPR